MEKSRENYRLVVMNNDTFEEVGSYNLSPFQIYMGIIGAALLVAVIVVAFIIFTPVKRYIPGYGNIQEYKEAMRLTKELEQIKADMEAQTEYTDNFRKILVGDIEEVEGQVEEVKEAEIPDSLLHVERIEEDEQLRQEMAMNGEIAKRNARADRSVATPGFVSLEKLHFAPPISGGVVSEGYDPKKKHYGIDIMGPKNKPITAIMDGYVFVADWTLETGNTIGIQHANNLISFYKHNSALLKKSGSHVKAGEVIAIIGNTGTLSSGPHLHFELWHNGKAINPESFIIFDQ